MQHRGCQELVKPLLLIFRQRRSLAEGEPQPDHRVQGKSPGTGSRKIGGEPFLAVQTPLREKFGLGLAGHRQGKHLRAILPQGRQNGLQFLLPLQAEDQAWFQGLNFGQFQAQGRWSADKTAGIDDDAAAAPGL